jgi:hypothetical protein
LYFRTTEFILCAVYALSALDQNILAVLLQPIKANLELSDTKVIAISLAIFSIMTALCSIVVDV